MQARSILFKTQYYILFGQIFLQIFFGHTKEIGVALCFLIINVVNLYEFTKLLDFSMEKHGESHIK